MASKHNDKGNWELVDTHLLPLAMLVPNTGQVGGIPENPRFLKDESFTRLKKSLTDDTEFLALNPLSVYELNGKYVVMCGNMRLQAARELGFSKIPCQIIPNSWDSDKIIAYMIKDNVAFAGYIVDNFSKYIVLDPFGGTGTTLIACEQLDRQCRMIELDPHYCDIIINRWEQHTGEVAVRIAE